MKLSTNQRIIELAKKHPNGFTATDVRAAIKAKPERIYVALSTLKKNGVLEHDAETKLYRLKTVQVTAPAKPAAQELDYYRRLFDALSNTHEQLEQKHEDALAIIRYLENKLYTVIQRDARSQG